MSLYDKLKIPDDYIPNIISIQTITKKILNYVPFAVGEYTDHGVKHSEDIEDIFLDFYFDNLDLKLSDVEKYLICLAIWTHDIGNILDRPEHEKKSVELLDTNEFLKYFKESIKSDIYSCLVNIILSHRNRFDLISYPDKKIHREVRLKLICAIFRLLDNCDITYNRNSYVFYSILQTLKPLEEGHKQHWESHENIDSLIFNKKIIKIGYLDYSKAKLLIDDLEGNLKQINKVLEEYGFPPYKVETFKSR